METGKQRWLSYIFLLATFLFIFYALDAFFGLHYEPQEDPHATQQNEGHEESISDHEASDDTHASPTEGGDEPETSKDSDGQIDDESTSYFENLKSQYAEKVANIPYDKTRTDVIIRYYHHDPDGDAAYELQQLKFYIHERPVDPAFKDYQSNAVFYGSNVSVEDIKMVTYTLLNQGLPIKKISSTAYEWKSNSIEIGTDTSLLDLPTLTMEDLRTYQK